MDQFIAPSIAQDFGHAVNYEWLETNGLGGYSSSSLLCTNTRRYHGLLVASLHPPVERVVLLSKLDETLLIGDKAFELGVNEYQGGTLNPMGHNYFQGFKRNYFPEFYYQADFVRLKKTIIGIQGENSVLIKYEVLAADQPFTLKLQPLLAPRDFHSLSYSPSFGELPLQFNKGTLKLALEQNLPHLYIQVEGSDFTHGPDWYNSFEYRFELERGQDDSESLYTPGYLTRQVDEGDVVYVWASTQSIDVKELPCLYAEELARRKAIVARDTTGDPFIQRLLLAADQFIVQRGKTGKSIMAGYHWFSDWGRDTMISLPGLCLETGNEEVAKSILQVYAEHVSEGMLPNRFSDYDEEPKYNNADATLWFFVAVYQYLQKTNDWGFVLKEILPVMKEILWWHDNGTRYSIKTDRDGLLFAGEEGVQISWMDAKVGDWVVTPRIGKAVEINALWYNAWKIFGILQGGAGNDQGANEAFSRANTIRKSFFETFWNPSGKYLYDFVNGTYKDPAIRPNQLFALSLPFMLLDMHQARSVLKVVEEQLYTRVGLRSLSPQDPQYLFRYRGNQYQRDAAYHQGVVWAWLLGPFVDALVRIKGEKGRRQAQTVIENMKPHIQEACVGSLSEIFEAEAPFKAKGCIAQAWSVAEMLRVSSAYRLYTTERDGLAPKTEKKSFSYPISPAKQKAPL